MFFDFLTIFCHFLTFFVIFCHDLTIAVLNLVDCKTNAQGTLLANKELDEYKVNYLVAMLDYWGHTTVILLTDQEPATMSIASAVRDRRTKSTIVRGLPAYSKQSAGHVGGANRLAAGLLRTYKLKLERKIGHELRPNDPIVPFLVNSVGWMITRFLMVDRHTSSFLVVNTAVRSLKWASSCGIGSRHECWRVVANGKQDSPEVFG